MADIGDCDPDAAGAGFAYGVAARIICDAARADRRGDARKAVGALRGAIVRGRSSALCNHHVHPAHRVIAIDRRAGGRDMVVDASHIAVGVVDIGQVGQCGAGCGAGQAAALEPAVKAALVGGGQPVTECHALDRTERLIACVASEATHAAVGPARVSIPLTRPLISRL